MISYAPDRGDLVWIGFDSPAGHEQGGTRPALVLSRRRYNELVGLALVCPITTKVKGYNFEVPLPDTLETKGVVLANHVRSMDWRKRNAEFIERAGNTLYDEVRARVLSLID